MTTAYLDVPVYSEFDGVAQGRAGAQITAAEAEALRGAMRAVRLIVRPSIVVLDELLCELDSDRAAMVRKLRIVRGLGNGFQGMLKQPPDLLRDYIRAYADGGPAPTILLPEDQRRAIVASLAEVCAGSTRHDAVLAHITGDVRGQKDAWKDSMRTAQAQVLAEIDWDRRDRDQRRALTFEMFYTAGAASLAQGFAEPLGCADAVADVGSLACSRCPPCMHAWGWPCPRCMPRSWAKRASLASDSPIGMMVTICGTRFWDPQPRSSPRSTGGSPATSSGSLGSLSHAS